MNTTSFTYHRRYTGPLQAAIFDWAGTTVDYGSRAPVAVFVEVFRRRGVIITAQQARAPMGLEKKDHIRAIAQQPLVAEQWQAVHARAWAEDDVEAMYRDSLPLQAQCVADYAELIPGTLETLAACRARGIQIGSSTGYSRQIVDALLPAAARHGYVPDSVVCPSDVPAGRPAPWMAFQNASNLRVYPMAALVKIGDTIPDIEEGLNAGMWTIGLTKSGNELGLSEAEIVELAPAELAARLAPIERRMRQAGAHYVVETIADIPPLLDAIAARLRLGEQP
ncbi:MAG TPA: phosphonoacetaldehyde hydrolase [Roseiflexaceae bacterium]|nr:phosphonoacetaldehyde hydrolase [Roseiflexaceae bacterium]